MVLQKRCYPRLSEFPEIKSLNAPENGMAKEDYCSFLLGQSWPIFRCKLLVLGRLHLHHCHFGCNFQKKWIRWFRSWLLMFRHESFWWDKDRLSNHWGPPNASTNQWMHSNWTLEKSKALELLSSQETPYVDSGICRWDQGDVFELMVNH